MNTYYRMQTNMGEVNRWYLQPPTASMPDTVDEWSFSQGKYIPNNICFSTTQYQSGRPLDFSEDAFGTPVVSEAFAKVIGSLCKNEIQLIPISIIGFSEKYYILNILAFYDCVDESRSKFLKFEKNDPIRPDLMGNFKIIQKLVINPMDIGDSNIFRLLRDKITIVVSHALKVALEHAKMRGLDFTEVYPKGHDLLQ